MQSFRFIIITLLFAWSIIMLAIGVACGYGARLRFSSIVRPSPYKDARRFFDTYLVKNSTQSEIADVLQYTYLFVETKATNDVEAC